MCSEKQSITDKIVSIKLYDKIQFRSVPLVFSTINLQMSVAVSPLLSPMATSTKALKVALEGFIFRHALNA